MRRSYGINEDYINYLKSLGCIYYLPLLENDLKDYIGGNSVLLHGYGSMVFDSNVGMYLITMPSTNQQTVFSLLTSATSSTFANNEYTTCIFVKRYTNSGWSNNFFMGNIGKYHACCCVGLGSSNITGSMSQWRNPEHYTAFSCRVGERKFYENGSLVEHDTASASTLASTWSSYNVLCSTNYNQAYNSKYYVRDMMMFNRILTPEEIKKVQRI